MSGMGHIVPQKSIHDLFRRCMRRADVYGSPTSIIPLFGVVIIQVLCSRRVWSSVATKIYVEATHCRHFVCFAVEVIDERVIKARVIAVTSFDEHF